MSPDRLGRQRGALRLGWVALGFLLLTGAAMLALMSIRGERNLFGEVVDRGRAAAATISLPAGEMRSCVINGKKVISNTDCKDDNVSSRAIRIVNTQGVEAPRVPVAPKPSAGSDPMTDKIIEKQLQ